MKATTIIIAAVLALQVNVLFAGNDTASAPVTNENTTTTLTSLVPTIPSVADFVDASVMYEVTCLAPTVPAEAQFDEMNYEMVSALNLAPMTPETADFNDADSVDSNSLAPVVPTEANFE